MFGDEETNQNQGTDEGNADDGGEDSGNGEGSRESTAALEARARDMGWAPKDKWKGNPSQWISAKEFVKRGEEILPILRANSRRSDERISQQDAQLQQLRTQLAAANEQLEVLTDMSTEQSRKAAKDRRRELITARVAARKDGDMEREAELDEQIEDQTSLINRSEEGDDEGEQSSGKGKGKNGAAGGKGGGDPASPMQHPDFRAWASENDWFGKDIRKTQYAIGVATEMRQTPEGRELKGRAFFDKVTEEVEAFWNRGQDNGKGRAASKVGAGGSSRAGNGSGGGGNSGDLNDEGRKDSKEFSDLPRDAQEVCNRQASRMVGKDRKFKTQADWRKFYIKDYFAQG